MDCALNGFFAPAQRERFLAAVSRRSSVRAFSGPPDVAQKSALSYAAARVCLPGVRIELAECQPEGLFRKLPMVEGITGTNRYAALIADDRDDLYHLYGGISGEAFVLEAVSLGLGTCWLGSFKRSGVDIPLEPYEKVIAVIAVGAPAQEPAGNKRKKLTEICFGDPTSWPLWAYNAAECVRQAPSALNLQPWQMAFAGRTLVLYRKRLGSMLDMGIALLHMHLGVGSKEHVIRLGEGREIASLIAEDRI
ncbi:MAG: hypothetical protein E7324_10575 [Clostridiales bacterium]|nr:hypothetical protein [Clostridiales bacterium]